MSRGARIRSNSLLAAALAIVWGEGCGCNHSPGSSGIPCPPSDVQVLQVSPGVASRQMDTDLSIQGVNFQSTPRVYAGDRPLVGVAFLSSGSLSALVPAGTPAGTYDLVVVNPNGHCGKLDRGLRVSNASPPVATSASPTRVPVGQDAEVVLLGFNFSNDAKVYVVPLNGAAVEARVSARTAGSLTVTVPVGSASLAGGSYVLRIQNGDGQSVDLGNFVVFDPNQTVQTWSLSPNELNIPREGAAAGVGLDEIGQSFLYVVGGDDRGGSVYDTIEVSALDRWGRPGPWRVLRGGMTVPRTDLALAVWPDPRDGRTYLFAVGGYDGTNFLDTVERARILSPTEAPTVTSIVPASSGALPAGTWYYVVSAVTPQGETIGSREAAVELVGGGQIQLTWRGVEGTGVFYRVYRTVAANGMSGDEVLIRDGHFSTTFSDAGQWLPDPTSRPIPPGGLSSWEAPVLPDGTPNLLNSARRGAAAVAATDPAGQWNLYAIAGGRGASTDPDHWDQASPSWERSILGSDPTNPASVGPWSAGAATNPVLIGYRVGGAAVPAEEFTQGPTGGSAIVVFGGYTALSGSRQVVVYARLLEGGNLSPWQGIRSLYLDQAREAPGAASANGRVYALGGWDGSPSAGGVLASVESTLLGPDGAPSPWTLSGQGLSTARTRAAAASAGGWIYVLGGYSDTTNTVLGSVEAANW